MPMSNRKHTFTAGILASVTLATGLVASSVAATAETAQPLPQFDNPVSGSATGLLSSPSTCDTLQTKSQAIADEWKKAVAKGDAHQANKLRVDYTNAAASWSQCMMAANKWLLNPLGS